MSHSCPVHEAGYSRNLTLALKNLEGPWGVTSLWSTLEDQEAGFCCQQRAVARRQQWDQGTCQQEPKAGRQRLSLGPQYIFAAQEGATYSAGESSLPPQPRNYEHTPSHIHLEACLLVDSRTSQVDNQGDLSPWPAKPLAERSQPLYTSDLSISAAAPAASCLQIESTLLSSNVQSHISL